MLEDQVGLGQRHLRMGRQLLDDENAQTAGVGRSDVQQEVICSGQEVDVPNLGTPPDPLGERNHSAARAGLQPDGDHRLQGTSQCCRIYVGMETANRTTGAERPHPAEAR